MGDRVEGPHSLNKGYPTQPQGVTPPPECPPGRLFVQECLRSEVIRWGHCSRVACHSGVNRAMFLVKQRFWWPGMACDSRLFVLGCFVCAVSKSSNRLRSTNALERMLRCLASQNPSSWNQQLSWVEYTHNLLPVSAMGLSPFECSLGYQPPLFPSMESEVAFPSAHAFFQRCHYRGAITAITVTKIISPVAVRLKLPSAYRRMYLVFHASKLKPVFHSTINPPVPVPQPPPRLVDGELAYSEKTFSWFEAEGTRISVLGGLGGSRSGGEKLGAC